MVLTARRRQRRRPTCMASHQGANGSSIADARLNHEKRRMCGLVSAGPPTYFNSTDCISRRPSQSIRRVKSVGSISPSQQSTPRSAIGLSFTSLPRSVHLAVQAASHFSAKAQESFGANVTTPTFDRHPLHSSSLRRGSFCAFAGVGMTASAIAAALTVRRKPRRVSQNSFNETRINVVDRRHHLRRGRKRNTTTEQHESSDRGLRTSERCGDNVGECWISRPSESRD